LSALPVPWWSFTKTVLAVASLILVEEGQLSLDELVEGRPFTLRQLLQHEAGIPDYGSLSSYHEAVDRNDPPWSQDELLTQVRADELLFEPGKGWSYSNVGYMHVRRIIENTTGKNIGQALHDLVFEPLNLQEVQLAHEPRDLVQTAWENAKNYHPGWVYHGLIIGTPFEAATLLHRVMMGTLLTPKLLGSMCRESRPLGGPLPGRPWRSIRYGLGLMIDLESPNGRCLGHTGQGPNSVSAVYHFPDHDIPYTVAAFAPAEEQAIVEYKVFDLVSEISP
jgi:D-alanyl-D-alanine carboxypeptidase